MQNLKVNTVTVVGANGTMGRNISAIFASFGKAKVYISNRAGAYQVKNAQNAMMLNIGGTAATN